MTSFWEKFQSNAGLMELPWIVAVLGVAVLALLLFNRQKRKKAGLVGEHKLLNDGELGAVPTYSSTLKHLVNELARVRRYQRPLTIVVLRLESDKLILDLKRSLVAEQGNGSVESYNQVMQTIQLVFSLVGSILKESLRESDIATYDVRNNQYIMMLPESNREQAELTITRLKKLLFKRTAGHLVAGIAEFPSDGLIMEDLVKCAIADCFASISGDSEAGDSAPESNFELQTGEGDGESENS